MTYKVFVDGSEGTTGLEINERLNKRDDVEILRIDPDKKKDVEERGRLLNMADVVFLCLPDDAARESVALVTNPDTRIIDGSTAHRTLDDWAYGIPELSGSHRDRIRNMKRVSVPGCHATGFNVIMYPLVREGYISPGYKATCVSITGYSGGGRRLIESYQGLEGNGFNSPCMYALSLSHKHLPEMQKHSGLDTPPLFMPVVADYYRGMTVSVPIHIGQMSKQINGKVAHIEQTSKHINDKIVYDEHASLWNDVESIHEFYTKYYAGQRFIKVMPYRVEKDLRMGFLDAEGCNNTNMLELYIFGNDEQLLITARLDNLGKGASGAAIQNMNIMLGVDEATSFPSHV